MSALAAALPYFHLGAIGPIQSFGVIVAVGVLIGAGVLRRYAEWHGVSDDHIRALTGWVTVSGFIGAHLFDVLFYQWNDLQKDPLLLVMIWKGISSYGGILGGAFGWWFYVWWKRLTPMRLYADITIIGLLVAFTIGRIGCTVVSDHVGDAVDPNKWYAALAMEYPRHFAGLGEHYPQFTGAHIVAWNLGLLEFLYLALVNIFILWIAFRPAKENGTDKKGKTKWIGRNNAGLVTALTGLLYAPVRFLLDFLRFNPDADPRYVGLTFAQWISILAFGASVALVIRIAKNGKPAEAVGRTAGDVQRQLKVILREDDEADAKRADVKAEPKKETAKPAPAADKRDEDDNEDEELAKEAEAAGSADEGDDDEADEDDEDEKPAAAASSASKPAGNRPKPGGGSSKKNKKKRR